VLINEVLDIARIESGRLSISAEPVRVSDVLQETLDLVRPLAAEKHVQLSGTDAVACDRHVLADRQRLKQVFLNLLSNAVKYNRPGGSVVVSIEKVSGHGHTEFLSAHGVRKNETGDSPSLRLIFKDTGPGIP